MEEVWKDVVGYEVVYKVSNFGNVYSVKRDKRLKPRNHRDGYLQVRLYINGKGKDLKVHRLVAQAFIPNPDNKPQVNHLDEDKTNNNVNNLDWVTNKENNNYGTKNKKIKVIYQDNTYEYWVSSTEFAREFGFDQSSICAVLLGRRKTYHGMRFEYINN